MRRVALALIACALIPAAAGAEPFAEGDRDVRVELLGGLYRVQEGGDEPTLRPMPLLIDFHVRDGEWVRYVYAECQDYNRGEHEARVTELTETDGRVHLELDMTVNPDPWIGGGPASYTIDLRRDGNHVTGSFTGTFKGRKVAGEVDGAVVLPWPAPVEGHTPPKPLQHPRLMPGTSGEITAAMNTASADAALAKLRQMLAVGMGGRVLDVSHNAAAAAYLYDGFCDQWPPEAQREMAAGLLTIAEGLVRGGGPGWNPNPGSNWQGLGRSGAGLCALAILNDPLPKPTPPPQVKWAEDMIELGPPANLASPEGVPVNDLGEHPYIASLGHDWIYAGPLPLDPGTDPFEKGAARARPEPGEKVTLGAETAEFKPLPGGLVRGKGRAGLDILKLTGRKGRRTVFLYSLLKVPHPQVFQVEIKTREPVWIAGTKIASGDVVRLPAGTYPVLVRIELGRVPPIGNVAWPVPVLNRMEDPGRLLEAYREELAYWKAHGGASLRAERAAVKAMRHIRRWLEYALGEQGWNEEGSGYTGSTFRLVIPFVKSYREVAGGDLVGRSGLPRIPVLYRTACVPGAYAPYLGAGGDRNPTSGGLAGRTAQFLPDRLRPLAVGGDPAELIDKALVDWAKGGFVFRRTWDGPDDVVTLAYAKHSTGGGGYSSPDAGDFRVYGLGGVWVGTIHMGKRSVSRRGSNVVFVDTPEPANLGAGARTTFYESYTDGSATLTMDLDALYRAKGSGADQGVRHTRALAVDYSGASGAPGLWVLADRVTGGGTKTWQMLVPREGGNRRKWSPPAVEITDRGFRFARGSKVLKVTFVSPAKVTVERSTTSVAAGEETHSVDAVRVRPQADASADVEFVAVMTLTGGEPPEVKVEGEGLGARVTVGDQAIRFDGERLVLSKTAKVLESRPEVPPITHRPWPITGHWRAP